MGSRAELNRLLAVARKIYHREVTKAAVPDAPDYDAVRSDLEEKLFDAFISFASSRNGRRYRNQAGQAVIEAVSNAFYRGYADAGGEDTEDDDEKWLTATQQAQLGFLPDVFAWLAEQAEAETITEDKVQGRVDGWLEALDGIYSEGVLRGSRNITLEFGGDDGEESCTDCQKLKGRRMKVNTILKQNLIPRPGNRNFECGGWRCQHYWFNPKTGEQYTF